MWPSCSTRTARWSGQPRLHRTAHGSPQIRAALAAAMVRVRLNHHLILRLGAYAAQKS